MIYNNVKKLLEQYPECRNSDRELLWTYWNTHNGYGELTKTRFLKCTSAESITRARRSVQKSHPELRAKKVVQEARHQKELNPEWLFR